MIRSDVKCFAPINSDLLTNVESAVFVNVLQCAVLWYCLTSNHGSVYNLIDNAVHIETLFGRFVFVRSLVRLFMHRLSLAILFHFKTNNRIVGRGMNNKWNSHAPFFFYFKIVG